MSKVMSRANLNALPGQRRKHPAQTSEPLPFHVLAYAFGQFCLPYIVPVSHRKVRSFQLQGARP